MHRINGRENKRTQYKKTDLETGDDETTGEEKEKETVRLRAGQVLRYIQACVIMIEREREGYQSMHRRTRPFHLGGRGHNIGLAKFRIHVLFFFSFPRAIFFLPHQPSNLGQQIQYQGRRIMRSYK